MTDFEKNKLWGCTQCKMKRMSIVSELEQVWIKLWYVSNKENLKPTLASIPYLYKHRTELARQSWMGLMFSKN